MHIHDEKDRSNIVANNNYQSFPASSDKLKIEFNCEESSTNIKTFLLPKFYCLDEIMNIFDKLCIDNQIKNKSNKGKAIETSSEYDSMSKLNEKRK